MEDYLKLGGSLLGHGTYSTVSRAIQRSTGRLVALKKVKSRMDEGISCSALREVKLLRELQQAGGSSASEGCANGGSQAGPGANVVANGGPGANRGGHASPAASRCPGVDGEDRAGPGANAVARGGPGANGGDYAGHGANVCPGVNGDDHASPGANTVANGGPGSNGGGHASQGACPHVIQLLDVFCHKQKLLMVFECMETDLGSINRNHILNAQQIKSLLLQLLRGLAYIHKAGIAHRDMKPDNLLLSADGCLKIADLGVARFMPPLESQLQRQQQKGSALQQQQQHQHHQHLQHQVHHQHSHGHPSTQPHSHQHPHQHLSSLGTCGLTHDGPLGSYALGGHGPGSYSWGGHGPPPSPCISPRGGPSPLSPSCLDAWEWLDECHSSSSFHGRGNCQNGHPGSNGSCSCRGSSSACAGGCAFHSSLHPVYSVFSDLNGTLGEFEEAHLGGVVQTLRPCPSPARLYTNQVSSRWYRPPELLFGATHYDGMAVDVWGVGCVFAELLLGRVWFQGATDMEQLNLIFSTLGVPNEVMWPGVSQLKTYVAFREKEVAPLSATFQDCPAASAEALDLLAGLMALNPSKRLTAQQALSHPYFRDAPEPTIGPLHQFQQDIAPIKAALVHPPSAMLSASHRKRCIRWSSALDSPAMERHIDAPMASHARFQQVEEVWPEADVLMGQAEEEPEEEVPVGTHAALNGDTLVQLGERAAATRTGAGAGLSSALRVHRRHSPPLRPCAEEQMLECVPQHLCFSSRHPNGTSHTSIHPPSLPVLADPPSNEQAVYMTGGQGTACGNGTISRTESVPMSEGGSLAVSLAPTSGGFPGSGFKRPRRLFESDSKPPHPIQPHAADNTCGKRQAGSQSGRRSSENEDGMHTESSGFGVGGSPSSAEGGRRWKRRLTMGSNEQQRAGRDEIPSSAPTPLPPPNFVGMACDYPTPPSTAPPTPSPMKLTTTRSLSHTLGAPPSPFCHAHGAASSPFCHPHRPPPSPFCHPQGAPRSPFCHAVCSHPPTPAASYSIAAHSGCLEDEPMPLAQDAFDCAHTASAEQTAQEECAHTAVSVAGCCSGAAASAECTPQVSSLGGAFGSQQLVCTEPCAGAASPPENADADMGGVADGHGVPTLMQTNSPALSTGGRLCGAEPNAGGTTPLHASHPLHFPGIHAFAGDAEKPPLAGDASKTKGHPRSSCGGVIARPHDASVTGEERGGSDVATVGGNLNAMQPLQQLPEGSEGTPFYYQRDHALQGMFCGGQEEMDAGTGCASIPAAEGNYTLCLLDSLKDHPQLIGSAAAGEMQHDQQKRERNVGQLQGSQHGQGGRQEDWMGLGQQKKHGLGHGLPHGLQHGQERVQEEWQQQEHGLQNGMSNGPQHARKEEGQQQQQQQQLGQHGLPYRIAHGPQHAQKEGGHHHHQHHQQQQQQHGGWVWDGDRERVFCAAMVMETGCGSTPANAPAPGLFCPGSLRLRCWSNRGGGGPASESVGGGVAQLEQQHHRENSPCGAALHVRCWSNRGGGGFASEVVGGGAAQLEQQHQRDNSPCGAAHAAFDPMDSQGTCECVQQQHQQEQQQQQQGSGWAFGPVQAQVATQRLCCEQQQQQQQQQFHLLGSEALCAHMHVQTATPCMTLPPTQSQSLTPTGVTAPMAMASLRGGTPTGISLPLACKLSTQDEGRHMSVGPTLLDERLRLAAGSVGSLVDLAVCPPSAPSSTLQSQPHAGTAAPSDTLQPHAHTGAAAPDNTLEPRPHKRTTFDANCSGDACQCATVGHGEGAQVHAHGVFDQEQAPMSMSHGSDGGIGGDQGDECKEASSAADAAAGAWMLMESVLGEGVRGVGLPMGRSQTGAQEGQEEEGAGGEGGAGGRGRGRRRKGVGTSRPGCGADGASLETTELDGQQQLQQQGCQFLPSNHSPHLHLGTSDPAKDAAQRHQNSSSRMQAHPSDHTHHQHLHSRAPLPPASQDQQLCQASSSGSLVKPAASQNQQLTQGLPQLQKQTPEQQQQQQQQQQQFPQRQPQLQEQSPDQQQHFPQCQQPLLQKQTLEQQQQQPTKHRLHLRSAENTRREGAAIPQHVAHKRSLAPLQGSPVPSNMLRTRSADENQA